MRYLSTVSIFVMLACFSIQATAAAEPVSFRKNGHTNIVKPLTSEQQANIHQTLHKTALQFAHKKSNDSDNDTGAPTGDEMSNGAASNSTGGSISSTSLPYMGGSLMIGATTVHSIYYGNWNNTTPQRSLLDLFVGGLSNTTWFNIEKEYSNKQGKYITGPILVGKSVFDYYSQGKKGTALAQGNIQTLVQAHTASKQLPKSTSAIYVVFTSPDVATSDGFCTAYCGYHSYYFDQAYQNNIVYAFIPDPATQCPSACSAEPANKSPNGMFGTDAKVSVLAHEMMESMSDPYMDAYSNSGTECADLCAWQFGSQVLQLRTNNANTNGSFYNLVVAGKNFLVQENFSIKQSKCLMGVVPTSTSSQSKSTTTSVTNKAQNSMTTSSQKTTSTHTTTSANKTTSTHKTTSTTSHKSTSTTSKKVDKPTSSKKSTHISTHTTHTSTHKAATPRSTTTRSK